MRRVISDPRGFTAVEIVIIVLVIFILAVLLYAIQRGPVIQESAKNAKCINNLQKNIFSGLLTYKERYGRYPDAPGDLFIASLYYTRMVSFEDAQDVFICPSDAANDGAMFTEEIANKIGLKPRREEDPDPKDNWDEDTVPPTGISYAARYNWYIEKGPHPGEKWYHLDDDPEEPTPLVCDDDEDENGKLSDEDFEFTHGDHYNVLWTGGKVKQHTEKVRVGQKGTILEALRN